MQRSSDAIQAYDFQRDESALFTLWQEALGTSWPISHARLKQVLAGDGARHLVFREEGQLLGFAASFQNQQTGRLAAIVVAPTHQRRGIGTLLHDAALAGLWKEKVTSIQLGALLPRFWCGVPGNLPGALTFFIKCGWPLNSGESGEGIVYDLVQDLENYMPDAHVHQRMQREHITIVPAQRADIADILAFEEREFPNWLSGYQRLVELGDEQDILHARDEHGQVVGTLLMYATQRSHPQRADLVWQTLLGEDAGAMGSVGVASAARGRGIGLALVAYASEILRERGVGNCLIDWLVLVDFYARAGYTFWHLYHTSERYR